MSKTGGIEREISSTGNQLAVGKRATGSPSSKLNAGGMEQVGGEDEEPRLQKRPDVSKPLS